MSFFTKAISALSNKKSELINDLNDKNKSIFDKSIFLSLIKTCGFLSFTTKLNSPGLKCIFVFSNSNFVY